VVTVVVLPCYTYFSFKISKLAYRPIETEVWVTGTGMQDELTAVFFCYRPSKSRENFKYLLGSALILQPISSREQLNTARDITVTEMPELQFTVTARKDQDTTIELPPF